MNMFWDKHGGGWVTADEKQPLPVMATERAHAEVHAGNHYRAGTTGTYGSGTAANLVITAPAGLSRIHMIPGASSSGAGTLTFNEAATTSGGSAYTSWNRDRNSLNTTTAVIVTGGTVSNAGTVMPGYPILLGGGIGVNAYGGDARGNQEWMLKAGSKYLFQFTSGTNGNVVTLDLDFYEEED